MGCKVIVSARFGISRYAEAYNLFKQDRAENGRRVEHHTKDNPVFAPTSSARVTPGDTIFDEDNLSNTRS